MKFIHTPEHKQLMKRLAAARKRSGLTQEQLVERVGEQRNFVAKYEQRRERAPCSRR